MIFNYFGISSANSPPPSWELPSIQQHLARYPCTFLLTPERPSSRVSPDAFMTSLKLSNVRSNSFLRE